MTRRDPPVPRPLPVAELDRRLRWRAVPVVVFVVTLAALAAVAVWSLRPVVPTRGLSPDPRAAAAHALVRGTRAPVAPWRLHSEFLGAPEGAAAPHPARFAAADSLLRRALAGRPFDPRLHAARGALELARRRAREAESHFRRANDLAGHYPDARIGLGVALALRADRTADPFEQRRLRLSAIGQLLDVRPGHPGEPVALYDRARLAIEVGRYPSARRDLARLEALAPGGAEAAAIRRLLAESR